MRALAALLLTCFCLQADEISVFGQKWEVPIAADWQVQGSGADQELRLTVPRPSTQPRRPTQFALAPEGYDEVTLECEVQLVGNLKEKSRSLILVYAYRDKDHFNYVHLSADPAEKVAVHNGVFHVYGGDRVRISKQAGPASMTTNEWTKVRLHYTPADGRVRVLVDGKPNVALDGVDLSLAGGRVGLGSFFDTANFRRVKITGKKTAANGQSR